MFVDYGASRTYCNALMGFIRAMLKWGVLRKLVPHQVYVEAKFVPALKQGKTRAYENPEREAVPDEVVRRTLPFMSPTVRAMVQVQRMTGMRPSEVCKMTVGAIDWSRGNGLWYYSPRHKTEGHIGKKPIPLGKPEQELIAPYLVGKKPSEAVFSPRTAMQEWHAERRANRKTKISPSQEERNRQRAKKPNGNSTIETKCQRLENHSVHVVVFYRSPVSTLRPLQTYLVRIVNTDTPIIVISASHQKNNTVFLLFGDPVLTYLDFESFFYGTIFQFFKLCLR